MASTEPVTSHEKQFSIQKLFVKDISFESPNAPFIFTQPWKPTMDINLNSNTKKAPQDLFEVSITATIAAKNEGKTAYLVEVTQVGVFAVKAFPEAEMGPLLGSFCPSVLFPYLREVVSEIVTKGGFPPMLLNPVNFDALYAQHHAQQDGSTRLN